MLQGTHEVPNSVGLGCLAHGDERAETVHGNRSLIFYPVAPIDVLLFSFFKQVGPGGHTKPHGHPHFFIASIWLVNAEEIPGCAA
jgi:hypothetical protein